MNEVKNMARTKDPSLKNEKGLYLSKVAQDTAWENKQEQFTVRVPKGTREQLKQYVEQKAKEFPTSTKYNAYNGKAYTPSVNALIKYLLTEETGITLD